MRGRHQTRLPCPTQLLCLTLVTVSLALSACEDELVQTATRAPMAVVTDDGGLNNALDCFGTEPTSELPRGATFGEGDTLEAWPLALGTYGPLEGPGLYVTARDTFRVYVNGHLVAQSASARSPVFVPLSLLPGENVVAIAVEAGTGTPALLAHLDELTREVVSGSEWKLSPAPDGNWRSPGYDDSAWVTANELAAFSELPGCDALANLFPANTTARWIGPLMETRGPMAFRTTIHVTATGFGAGTSGGGDAEPQLASTWEQFETLVASDMPATILLAEGDHDLRLQGAQVEAVEVCANPCAEDPERTSNQVLSADETCAAEQISLQRDGRVLRVGSNKTILGLGRGAAVRGVSFDLGSSQNIIVRNVAVYDINRNLLEAGDAFTLGSAQNVWIDHLTFKWVSDAFVEVLAGSNNVTVSYALFEGGTDAECGGQERWGMTINGAQVTIHHSRFDQVSTRAPLADGSTARAHLFNNVYSNSADWTVGSGCLAQVLLEGSVFENVEVVSRLSTCSDTGERGLMNAVEGSNLYRDGSAVHVGADASEPHDEVFVPEYDYEVEAATDAWSRVLLRSGAGGPWALPVTLN